MQRLYMGPVCTSDHLPETWYLILNHWAVLLKIRH